MKKVLLTGIAALFLATSTAQAKTWHVWKCRYGIEVEMGVRKDENWIGTQYTEIRGTRYNPQKHRIKVIDNPATVYLNGRRCKSEIEWGYYQG